MLLAYNFSQTYVVYAGIRVNKQIQLFEVELTQSKSVSTLATCRSQGQQSSK